MCQGLSLLLPVGHIRLQQVVGSVCLFQAFGGQDFNALRQQHSGFTLHHDLVLQIFYRFDFFIQLQLQTGKGFTRQRGTRFGGISLPCHGICNVQARSGQHGVCTLCPLSCQHVLSV